MSEQILITKELRLRITDLEYEDLSPEDYAKEIQRIYIEEMGKPLPAEIEIFTSYQSEKVDAESEYVGSAIRFYSEEGGIDEVYIVSEGTQGLLDWLYNVEALMAGRNYGQIVDVNNFMEDALDHFGYSNDNYNIPIVALGHSQAHNTNASAYLIFDKFTRVYGVNSAQLNYYQLYRADLLFAEYLQDMYPVLKKDSLKIYDLDSDELKQHAMDFYEDKADNIFQERSEQDLLYAVSNYPGFFMLGTDNTYETDSTVPGFSESFNKIDEIFLKKIQKVAYTYAVAVEQGDGLRVIDELLGIDYEFVMNFKIHQYFTQKPKVSETIKNLDKNLPEVLDIIYEITNNKDSILTELENVGYITSSQKVEIIEVIANIEKQLIIIEESISNMSKARDIIVPDPDAVQLQIDMSSFTKIMDAFDEIQNEIERLQKDEYKEILKQIAESHGIGELLETFNTSNKKYIDSEVYLKSTEGSEEIWVSLAATGKMCGLGKNNLTLKSEKVEELQKSLEEKVYEEFETQRTRARVAVDYMEASPDIDRPFLHPHGFSESYNRTITRINIHEEIPRFEDTTLDMSQQITKLKTSIEKGYLLIEQYRDSIEKLFNEEADIAEQINFIEEVYYDG